MSTHRRTWTARYEEALPPPTIRYYNRLLHHHRTEPAAASMRTDRFRSERRRRRRRRRRRIANRQKSRDLWHNWWSADLARPMAMGLLTCLISISDDEWDSWHLSSPPPRQRITDESDMGVVVDQSLRAIDGDLRWHRTKENDFIVGLRWMSFLLQCVRWKLLLYILTINSIYLLKFMESVRGSFSAKFWKSILRAAFYQNLLKISHKKRILLGGFSLKSLEDFPRNQVVDLHT